MQSINIGRYHGIRKQMTRISTNVCEKVNQPMYKTVQEKKASSCILHRRKAYN